MKWFNSKHSSKEQLHNNMTFNPSQEDIDNACLSFRHDFGLLEVAEQNHIREEALQWCRAWGHSLQQKAEGYNK